MGLSLWIFANATAPTDHEDNKTGKNGNVSPLISQTDEMPPEPPERADNAAGELDIDQSVDDSEVSRSAPIRTSKRIPDEMQSDKSGKDEIQPGKSEAAAAASDNAVKSDPPAGNNTNETAAVPANPSSDKMAAADVPAENAASPDTPKTGSDAEEAYSADDLDLLARLIHAEAQAEPYEAKVAVGAVVINRIGPFADSIKEVIYQNINGYYQFTPVENGWINKPAGADSVKAAKEALSGADPTGGALFYYDNQTTNEWILAKPVSVTFGNMIYAY